MSDSFSGDYLGRRGADPEEARHAQEMAAARRQDMVRMLNEDAREENFGMGVHDQGDQDSAETRLWAERGGPEQLADFASDTLENALQGVMDAGHAMDQSLRDTAIIGPWYRLYADTTNQITQNAAPGLWNASQEWQRKLESDDTENDRMAQMFFQYAIPFAGWMKGFNAAAKVAGSGAALSKVQHGASAVGADVVTSWTALEPHFDRFSQFLTEFETVNNIPVLNRTVEYLASTDGTDAEERLKNIGDSLLAGGLITPVVGGIVGALKIMRNGYRMAKAGELGMTMPGTNQRGFIAGPQAMRNEDVGLDRAIAMQNGGKTVDEIHAETGWYRGKDDMWRLEVPDTDAGLNPKAQEYFGQFGTVEETPFAAVFMDEVIQHERLFQLYPDLKEVRFTGGIIGELDKLKGVKPGGWFDGNRIHVVAENESDLMDSIMHEVQHYIQRSEAFARGGSPQAIAASRVTADARVTFLNKELSRIAHEMDDVAHGKLGQKTGLEKTERIAQLRTEYDSAMEEKLSLIADHNLNDSPLGVYYRLSGEVEARNVARRRTMEPDELEIPPFKTEDVPTDEQIVRKDAGRQLARDPKTGRFVKGDK